MGTPTHPFKGQQTFLDQIFKVTSSGLYGRISKFPVFNVRYFVFALQISDNFYLPSFSVGEMSLTSSRPYSLPKIPI